MKTAVITASVALIASASAAFAADPERTVTPGPFDAPPAFPQVSASQPTVPSEPRKAPLAYVKTKIYDWTGFYVGINGGGGFGSADWSSVPDATSGRFDVTSGLIGGTAGYNLQAGEPWVLGVELDLDWTDFRGTASTASCAPGCELRVPWLDTSRLRFGWAFDGIVPGGILPYVTGGVVVSRPSAGIGGPFGMQGATNFFGWTVGAGVEFVITDALRAKAEYLHVDTGSVSCDVACNGGPVSFSPNANIFRAGLNYRLWMN